MFYFTYVEKWFCRKADYISVPILGAKQGYYPEFHEKIRIIPQGFRLDNLDLPEYKKTTNYPVFGYAGSIFPGQHDPRAMLAFLATYKKNFRFVMYTRETDLISTFVETLGEKLIVRDFIPREELLKVLAGMDFNVNFSYKSSIQLPHKLIDYAICGRPVLNISTEKDFSSLEEFLDGNYTRKMDLAPPENYDIEIVAKKFIQLHTKN